MKAYLKLTVTITFDDGYGIDSMAWPDCKNALDMALYQQHLLVVGTHDVVDILDEDTKISSVVTMEEKEL